MILNLAIEIKSFTEIISFFYKRKIPTQGENRAMRERYIGTYIMGKHIVKEIGGKTSRLKDENECHH
ncbi:MAG: hypothetical protein LBU32_02150 [Clostridiales bacterium]|nr:hypothetical protein [Clostridiales bacterium]